MDPITLLVLGTIGLGVRAFFKEKVAQHGGDTRGFTARNLNGPLEARPAPPAERSVGEL